MSMRSGRDVILIDKEETALFAFAIANTLIEIGRYVTSLSSRYQSHKSQSQEKSIHGQGNKKI